MSNPIEIILFKINSGELSLQDCSNELRDNEEIVRGSVRYHGNTLEYASDRLRSNKEIVSIASKSILFVEQKPILSFVSEEIRSDKELVIALVSKQSGNLQYASLALKEDKEVVLAAVTFDGRELQYASCELRDDYKVVLQAVKQSGLGEIKKGYERYSVYSPNELPLSFASQRLKSDQAIVLEAVKNYGNSLLLLSNELRLNRDVIKASLTGSEHCIISLPDQFQTDRELVLMIVGKRGDELKSVPDNFKDDEEVVLAALTSRWYVESPLQYASERLRGIEFIVKKAVRQTSNNFRHASGRLRADKQIVLLALQDEIQKRFLDEQESYYQTDFGVSEVLPFASPDLQKDPELILKASSSCSLRAVVSSWSELSFLERMFYKTNQDGIRGDDANRELVIRVKKRRQIELRRKSDRDNKTKFEEYKLLRKDIEGLPAYKAWRKSVLDRDNHACVICGSVENLEVDHRHQSFYSILKRHNITNAIEAYECTALWRLDNGAVLCKSCHDKTISSQRYFSKNN